LLETLRQLTQRGPLDRRGVAVRQRGLAQIKPAPCSFAATLQN
jgi:hypothetical protein